MLNHHNLTPVEYRLLYHLVRNAGQPVSRSLIAEHVWKYEVDPATNVVDVYINYLRKKLGDDKAQPLIRTVRGVGYMISGYGSATTSRASSWTAARPEVTL